jgi:Arc/MetJ-type ribon-helix-helix transcriptional regulator
MSTTLTIELPPSLAAHLERRVEAGNYSDPGAYIRDLIARDHQLSRTEALDWIESQVMPALESLDRGEGHEPTAEFWTQLRSDAEARAMLKRSP